MKLLPFELKKMLFSKKLFYLMLLLVAGVVLLFLRNVIFESYVEKEERQRIESLVQASQSNFRMHQQTLAQDPENEEVQKLQQINAPLLDRLYELRMLVTTEDWQYKLTVENDALEYIKEYKEEGGDFPLTYKEIDHQFALHEKLLEEDVRPEHDTYSKTLPNFMKMVINLLVNFGTIIIILLLVGDIMSSEFENRSIQLLFMQPLQRTHILTSKFWTSIVSYLVTVGLILGTVMIVGLIFGEKGTFDYPMVMEKNNVITFMTVWEYMILALVVASVTVFLIISLALLYSLFFKHTLSTLFVLLATLLAGYALTTFISWETFAWFNPFQYLRPQDMIMYQNDRVWYQGIPVILLMTIICYVIARQKIKSSKVD
ncbi:ABC transporter permease subunit [Ornithinibacillus sp. L9]|uniref:ABC transporter permease subunit n=1 Tax=Ornithinibacillus caprae TaxID=2678566 RepID=A0A6N8FI77_9BACI|nr:ABC transporter permease [Ornithinibacillus caprae]MUK89362.1 ABC transporter permease subunit [Ornithinibacillus caprae]